MPEEWQLAVVRVLIHHTHDDDFTCDACVPIIPSTFFNSGSSTVILTQMWNAVESYTYFVCVCVSLKESRVYWKLSMKCLQAMNETKWNVAKKNVRWTSERAKSGIERRCTLGAVLYCEWFFRARERKTSGVSCCVHEIWQLFEVLKHQFSTMSTPHFKHLYVCAAINSLRIRLEAFRKCSFVLLAKRTWIN